MLTASCEMMMMRVFAFLGKDVNVHLVILALSSNSLRRSTQRADPMLNSMNSFNTLAT